MSTVSGSDVDNSLANKSIAELSYIDALFGIIIAWILVALWQRVVENMAYNFFGLNPESAFHAFIVAIVMTVIFLVLIRTVSSPARDLLVGNTAGAGPDIAPPGIPVETSAGKLQNNSTQMKNTSSEKIFENVIQLRSSLQRARRS